MRAEFAELESFGSKKVATTLTETAAQIGEHFGVETLRVQADLTKVDQVERIMKEVVDKWGRIDILGGPAVRLPAWLRRRHLRPSGWCGQ